MHSGNGSLFRALSECELNDGVLSFNGLDSDSVIKLNQLLREALLGYEIPHYKVIGAYVSQGGVTTSANYITKIRGTNKSYVELLSAFNDLVFAEARGEYRSVPNDIPPNQSGLGYIMAIDNEVKSDNGSLFYDGCGLMDTAQSLVKDVNIIKLNTTTANIHLAIYKGTGMVDFTEAKNLIYPSYTLVPVRAVYDLNSIFSIFIPNPGDTTIKLWYKKPVNESVLLKILQDFGKDNM